MSAFIRWKMQCWVSEAAARFNRPDLLDARVPLARRFAIAETLLTRVLH